MSRCYGCVQPPKTESRLIYSGHKDYLFQKPLARALPLALGIDTFRFDFRGNGESEGLANFSNFEGDVDDLSHCVEFLREHFDYDIYALIGHSRGAIVSLRYATEIARVPYVINCSGRYRMKLILSRMSMWEPEWKEKGYYLVKNRVRGREIEMKLTRSDVDAFVEYDSSIIKDLPPETDVLTIHGLNDEVVPVQDAALIANILAPRHTLHLLPNANHNFVGKNNQVVAIIVDYFSPIHERVRFWNRHERMGTELNRWIDTPGVQNVRDLGGWRCTRWRKIQRSQSQVEASVQRKRHTQSEVLSFAKAAIIHADGQLRLRGNDSESSGHDTNESMTPSPTSIVLPDYFIRPRLIFRSGNLSQITDAGQDLIRRLGITTIFDLRSEPEIEKYGFIDIAGTHRLHVPIFSKEDYSPDALAERWGLYTQGGSEGYASAYLTILEKSPPTMRAICSFILDHPREPFLFHCTAGKDRTGIIAMLLMDLCGVEEDVLSREYEMTEREWTEAPDMLREGIRELDQRMNAITSGQSLEVDEDDSPRGWLLSDAESSGMMSAKKDAMEQTMIRFRARYGDAVEYLVSQCGFSHDQVFNIRSHLTGRRQIGQARL